MTAKAQFYEREFNGEQRDFVRISVGGMKDVFEAPVRPEDLTRFPEDWEAYKKSKGVKKTSGTPLNDLPGMTEPRRVELELAGIETVEQLDKAEDAMLLALGNPYVELQKIAKLQISAKKTKAPKKETKPLEISIKNESTDDMPSSK